MIYHKYKLVFVPIAKNASTSVHYYLYNKTDHPNNHHSHATITQLYDLNDSELLSTYYSFAIVRNPYNRLWSAWKHLYMNDQHSEEDGMVSRFHRFVRNDLHKMINSVDDRIDGYWHIKPQSDYITFNRKTILVDKILHLETLHSDWIEFADWYDSLNIVPYKMLRNMHVTHTSVQIEDDPYNDSEIKEIVYNIYKNDFELFGYNQ